MSFRENQQRAMEQQRRRVNQYLISIVVLAAAFMGAIVGGEMQKFKDRALHDKDRAMHEDIKRVKALLEQTNCSVVVLTKEEADLLDAGAIKEVQEKYASGH